MVLVSILAMQGSQAAAKLSFALAGPVVITALRFGFGAPLLWMFQRPRTPSDRRSLFLVLALGTSLAAVSVTIYQSFARLPIGIAVTLQFLGALTVSILTARRLLHVTWALMAAGGVFLINYQPAGELSTAGIAFALTSAAAWAAYMLIGAHAGARLRGQSILAPASLWAALLIVPFAVADEPQAFLDPRILGCGLGVAVLSTVLANSLELKALRRMPPGTFGVLVSLEPVVAALLGLVVLDQQLTPGQWLATVLIVAASIGVTTDRGHHRRSLPPARLQRAEPTDEDGEAERRCHVG
jgi:inner membrane transporter RhtA